MNPNSALDNNALPALHSTKLPLYLLVQNARAENDPDPLADQIRIRNTAVSNKPGDIP